MCDAVAKIQLPWAGEILKYCPVHANQLAVVAQAMGQPMKAERINTTEECHSKDKLTKEQIKRNNEF